LSKNETNEFEFHPKVATSRQKMLVVAVGIIPFLFGLHSEKNETFKVFGNEFKSESMGSVILLLGLMLFVLSLTYFLRLLESSSKLKMGMNGLDEELRKINKSIEALKEFQNAFPQFQKHVKSQLSQEEIDKLREEKFFDKCATSANEAINQIKQLRAEILGKDQTGTVSTNIDLLNSIQRLDNEDFRSCISFFSRVPDRYETNIDIWERNLQDLNSFLSQAKIALSNLSVLENSQKFKNTQSWATKLRWEWVEGWLPLVFSIVVLIWSLVTVFR